VVRKSWHLRFMACGNSLVCCYALGLSLSRVLSVDSRFGDFEDRLRWGSLGLASLGGASGGRGGSGL
jgi:hypothetical protein